MFLDNRLFGANSTSATRDEWAKDSWPNVELIWSLLILLHLAALIHIDPLVLHVLSVMIKLMPETASPIVTPH